MGSAMDMSCTVNHDKPEAYQAKLEKCVSQTLTEMSDPVQCTAYFSTVASDKCSVGDIQNMCQSKLVKSFTVEDARSLCMAEMGAKRQWWMSKYDPTQWQ